MPFAIKKNVVSVMPRTLLELIKASMYENIGQRHLCEELQRRKIARLVGGKDRHTRQITER